MQIEIFCLCNAVRLNAFKQPSVIDIFDTIEADGEPVLVGPFIAAASIRFYKNEAGIHRFNFVVREEGGKQLISSTEIVSISELVRESTTYFLQSNMGQTGLKFGTYYFSIQSGGKQIAHTPLYVMRHKT